MPRIRYLKPDFFKDEDLAKLPYETRLFFEGLWCFADKAGRLEDRPERLKAEIFPYDSIDVKKCLEQLAQKKQGSGQPFINRYSVNGQQYIQILNWFHQKPHHTEKESTIPPAPPYGEGNGEGKPAQPKCGVKQPLSNGDLTVKQPLKGKESNIPPIFATQTNKIKSISEQIRIDRSFGKCCYHCGRSAVADSGRFVWRERLPFCELSCYRTWVEKEKPEPVKG